MEIYKTIPNCNNKYEVSNYGNVRNRITKKLISQYECRKYMTVGLYYDNKIHNFRVHRLVAMAFIKNFTKDCVVMHLDNNTKNNRLENLKCGTQKENIQQCYKQGRMCFQGKKVKQYDKKGNFIKSWNTQMEIQNELGYRQNFISMCCNGKKKSAYGYRWELISDE